MTTTTLRMPDYLKTAIDDVCKSEKISINQFILNALSEKVSALKTVDIINEKAKNASKDKFLKALQQVPSRDALKGDELF